MEQLGGAPIEIVESSDWPIIMRLYWQLSAREKWETNQKRNKGGTIGRESGPESWREDRREIGREFGRDSQTKPLPEFSLTLHS